MENDNSSTVGGSVYPEVFWPFTPGIVELMPTTVILSQIGSVSWPSSGDFLPPKYTSVGVWAPYLPPLTIEEVDAHSEPSPKKKRHKLDPLMSSASSEWGTPQGMFDKLDTAFHFQLDPCASAINHKCPRFFTKEQNGLSRDWHGTVFMNPPYGRGIVKWIEKAWEESQAGALVVCLVPARTDTRWFSVAFAHAYAITFIPGRLKFVSADGRRTKSATFPSALVTFGKVSNEQLITLMRFGSTWLWPTTALSSHAEGR